MRRELPRIACDLHAMCSFLLTNALILRVALLNRLMQLRGPDATTQVQANGLLFMHNLLHMSGQRLEQPLRDAEGRVLALFNGEVYNYRELEPTAGGDAEALVPAYLRWGETFVRRLDGEFAICIADLARGVFVLAVDVFGTKPLFYGRTEDPGVARREVDSGAKAAFGVASYRSALSSVLGDRAVRPVPPNTILVLDHEFRELGRRAVREFDVRQWKSSYRDWHEAFEAAVRQRAAPQHLRHPLFMGLSSGYDSGALHGALLKLGLAATTYSLGAAEDLELVRRRVRLGVSGPGRPRANGNGTAVRSRVLQLSRAALGREVRWVRGHVELHREAASPNLHDPATFGLSAICRDARARGGHRALLSAAGGDEILSDYGHPRATPAQEPGRVMGIFPEDLASVFPWRNFFLGRQRDFLMKEEFAAGAHGLEARFPFLDLRLAQEFLWLSWDSKNRHYKAPLHTYMASRGYPFVAPLLASNRDGSGGSRPAFRKGFLATDGLLHSRTSIVTDFAAPVGRLESRFERCWARVVGRARGRHLALRWRADVLHACAGGDVDPLARALQRCAAARVLNETEPDADSRACGDSYFLANREGEPPCLALLESSGGLPAVEAALTLAAAAGLCREGPGCAKRAQSWGATEEVLAALQARGRTGDREVPGVDMPETSIDPECGVVTAAIPPAGPGSGAQPAMCAEAFDADHGAFLSRSSLAPVKAAGRPFEVEEDLALLWEACSQVRGGLAEVWFDIAAYFMRLAGKSPAVLSLLRWIQDHASPEELLRAENFYACLPEQCLYTAPLERAAVVWCRLLLGHFLGQRGACEIPPPPDVLVAVPTAPLAPLRPGVPAAGADVGPGARCVLALRRSVDGARSRPAAAASAAGLQEVCRCTGAGGAPWQVLVDLGGFLRRHAGLPSVGRALAGLLPPSGDHSEAHVCMPAQCVAHGEELQRAAAWHLFVSVLLRLPAETLQWPAPQASDMRLKAQESPPWAACAQVASGSEAR